MIQKEMAENSVDFLEWQLMKVKLLGGVQKNSLSQKEMYREERRKRDCGIVTKVISILLRLARSRAEAFSLQEELACMSIVLLTLTFMLGEAFITI